MPARYLIVLLVLLLAACGGGSDSSSGSNAITAFSFRTADNPALHEDVTATINSNTNQVTATFPSGTDVTNLVADFSITGSYVSVDGVAQDSGVSANDFSTPLPYIVVNGGSTREYTVTADLLAWYQDAYLKASNSDAGDSFGASVAIDDGTIVTGAPMEASGSNSVLNNTLPPLFDNGGDENGAVYVFSQDGENWLQEAYLKSSNNDDTDRFGVSVAIDNDTIIVGADQEDSSTFGIENSATDVSNDASNNSGAAYVFVRDEIIGTWSQKAYIKPTNPGAEDYFGAAVAISGDTAVVGAYGEDSDTDTGSIPPIADLLVNSGAAYVFHRDSSSRNWSQEVFLKASNRDSNQEFGSAVAIDENLIVIGARLENSSATGVMNTDNSPPPGGGLASGSGAAYIFTKNGSGNWFQDAYLKAANTGIDDNFGSAVAISGDMVVVGAPHEGSAETGINGPDTGDSLTDAGAAYVFIRDDAGDWSQDAYLKPSNTASNMRFGSSVAINGDTVLVGAPGEGSGTRVIIDEDGTAANDGLAVDSGAVYVFKRDATGTWVQDAYLKSSNSDEDDLFGTAVALSDSIAVAGSIAEAAVDDGIDDNDGSASTDNTASDSGAAYIFSVK